MTEQHEHQGQNPEALRAQLINRVASEAQRLSGTDRSIEIPLTPETRAQMIIGRVDASQTADGVARQVMASSLVGPHETHAAVTIMPLPKGGSPIFCSVEPHQALEMSTRRMLTDGYLAEMTAWCDMADFNDPVPYQLVAQRAARGQYASWQALHFDPFPAFEQ